MVKTKISLTRLFDNFKLSKLIWMLIYSEKVHARQEILHFKEKDVIFYRASEHQLPVKIK